LARYDTYRMIVIRFESSPTEDSRTRVAQEVRSAVQQPTRRHGGTVITSLAVRRPSDPAPATLAVPGSTPTYLCDLSVQVNVISKKIKTQPQQQQNATTQQS
ncbi:hypothetical protein THAOC_19073, partial [Thalassiosira oceanica]